MKTVLYIEYQFSWIRIIYLFFCNENVSKNQSYLPLGMKRHHLCNLNITYIKLYLYGIAPCLHRYVYIYGHWASQQFRKETSWEAHKLYRNTTKCNNSNNWSNIISRNKKWYRIYLIHTYKLILPINGKSTKGIMALFIFVWISISLCTFHVSSYH